MYNHRLVMFNRNLMNIFILLCFVAVLFTDSRDRDQVLVSVSKNDCEQEKNRDRGCGNCE